MTIHEVLCAHVIVQIVLMVVAMVIALVMLLCVFQLTNNGPLFWVIFLCFLQGLCGMCLGKGPHPVGAEVTGRSLL